MRGASSSFGYEDVALLDIYLNGGKPSTPFLSKSVAKTLRKKAYKALVKEYATQECIHELDAEIEVDCIICCLLIEKKAESIDYIKN
jgi:hypothetical protein